MRVTARFISVVLVAAGVLLPLFLAPVLLPAAAGPPALRLTSSTHALPDQAKALSSPSSQTYAILFEQTGLSSSSWWTVTLNGTSRATPGSDPGIAFSEPNGSYSFQVTANGYQADPASGRIVVQGQSVNEKVIFSVPPESYNVTFNESGLAPGTDWTVTLNAAALTSNTSSVTFTEINGSYSYEVAPIAGYEATYLGQVTVQGEDIVVPVRFAVATYPVTFEEAGLAEGTPWGVMIDSNTLASAGTTIQIEEPNGSFQYNITPIEGYSANYTGAVAVAGAPVQVPVQFSTVQYPVVFIESGLPSGSPWTISVNGASTTTNTSTVNLSLSNGTYDVLVSTQLAYQASPASPTLDVHGSGSTVPITFVAKSFVATFTPTGLPQGTSWGVTTGGVTRTAVAPATIQVAAANGTYNFSVSPVAGYVTSWAGRFAVDGANTSVAIAFSPYNYSVTFAEQGLPSGTWWSVNLSDGAGRTLTSPSIHFDLPNGTYGFTTGTLSLSYQTLEESGNVSVAGAAVGVTVPFEYAYPVTFSVGSLPGGVTWYVNLTGNLTAPAVHAPAVPGGIAYAFVSSAPVLIFALPNGSYEFTVASNTPSWTPQVTNHNLSVAGSSPPPQSFQPIGIHPSGVTPESTYLTWIVIGAAVAAIVGVAAMGYRTYALRPAAHAGPDAIDELYISYDLTTEIDPATTDGNPDALDDIF